MRGTVANPTRRLSPSTPRDVVVAGGADMTSTIELQRIPHERYEFVLYDDDGSELLRGFPCSTRGQAKRAAEATALAISQEDRVFQRSLHGELFLAVHDERDEMIARSPHVTTEREIEDLLTEARHAAPRARIIDMTAKVTKATH